MRRWEWTVTREGSLVADELAGGLLVRARIFPRDDGSPAVRVLVDGRPVTEVDGLPYAEAKRAAIRWAEEEAASLERASSSRRSA